jgi:hypothetical protein
VKTARVGREPTLSGAATISELDTSAAVTLPVRYNGGAYTVTFGTVTATVGNPAASSLLEPSASNQTGSGFTLTLQAAPGAGTAVSAPWSISP